MDELKNTDFKLQGYVDDIMEIINRDTIEELYDTAKITTDMINKWCNKNNFIISNDKTKYMIITNNNNPYITQPIYIDNKEIEKVNEFKYLGIIIDTKLNWKSHINTLYKKLQKYIPIMYNLRNILCKNTLLTIYKTKILSSINYGLMIYYNIKSKENCQKIEKLQIKIIRIITRNIIQSKEQLSKNYNILTLEQQYKLQWLQIIHTSIYNYKKLPAYFQKLYTIKQNRNGIKLITNYRNKQIGNRQSKNLATELWNNLDINLRNTQDIFHFKKELIKQYLK